MHHLLGSRPPWWVVGPALGAIVVLVQVTLNERMGIVGGFSAAYERTAGRTREFRWKLWFVGGVVLGGTLFGLLSGRAGAASYGWLTRTFTGGSEWLVAPVLAGAGVLIGYGSKTA